MKFVAFAAAAALAGPFYADPDSDASRQATKYEMQGRTEDARLMRSMAAVPQAFWFTNGTPKQVRKQVDRTVDKAAKANAVPVLVAYNVPNRDCGGYSAGGAQHYSRWIDGFADGIKRRRAIVILEPDALASGCAKLKHVRTAVKRLDRLPDTALYVDAGHSSWQPVKTMKRRLKRVGARAAALNVSNFRATDELIAYGTQLGMHFVIDTSRNGRGPKGTQWCNPPGRALGALPTAETGNALVDAFLWIKTPGESDGTCRGGPPAGRWWPRYALGLARRANPPLG